MYTLLQKGLKIFLKDRYNHTKRGALNIVCRQCTRGFCDTIKIVNS